MQVLGWQCRMLHKYALDYESGVNLNNNNNNDPEEPEGGHLVVDLEEPMVAPPVPGPSPAAPLEETVLAGFRDCSEEAIRYLVDVEQLSEDDPLVLGLKQHLWDKQQQLDVQRILGMGCCGEWSQGESVAPSSVGQEYYGFSQQQYRTVEHPAGVLDPNLHPVSRLQAQSTTDSPMEQEEGSSQIPTTIPSQSQQQSFSHTSSQKTVINSGSQYTHDNSALEALSQSLPIHQGDALSVMDLALLAQSNPAIASLTEEILSLLEGAGGQESDLESDFDLDFDEEENGGHSSE